MSAFPHYTTHACGRCHRDLGDYGVTAIWSTSPPFTDELCNFCHADDDGNERR